MLLLLLLLRLLLHGLHWLLDGRRDMRGHLRGHGVRVGRHGKVGRVRRRVHGHGRVVHLAVAVLHEEVLLLLLLAMLIKRGLTVVEAVLGRGKRRRGAEDARITRVAAGERRCLRRETGSGGCAARGAGVCALLEVVV